MVNSRLVIGLTGGIGSGKSEVSRRFAALGITVIDADEIAREAVLPGQAALAEIARHFGDDVITDTGTLDRAKLRNIIFSDPESKRWLEALLHPLINQLTRTRLAQATSAYAILSSPLLLETQQYTMVNRVLVVDTTEELQLARASRRDHSNAEQIKAIIATQISRADRLARADDIIHNSGDLNELDIQVMQAHQLYLSLASH
jgi:dephospho-CoA kinase